MAKWPLRKQIVWGLAVGLAISCAVVPATVAFLVWRAERCADWTTREFLRSATMAEAAPCIRAAAAVDVVDGWGLTPLVWAVGDTPDPLVVRALLDAGADPMFTDRLGQTPLHHGAENPRAEVVAMLLDAGADPNARTEDGTTPLHHAAHTDNAMVIAKLLAAGADAAAINSDGLTPLHNAKLTDAVRMLLVRERRWTSGCPTA